MSSQKLIFTFLIIASIVGLSLIFIRRFSQASCPQDDVRICSFIQTNREITKEEMNGSYIVNQDDAELSISWQKKEKLSSVQINKSENEILNTIIDPRYVYIKDESDNKWWREQRNTVLNALNELPFNPELFFTSFESIIKEPSTQYMYIEDRECGDEQCHRYKVTYPEQTEKDQMFIYFSTTDFKLRSVFLVEDKTTEELDITYSTNPIAVPQNIKIVSSGRNIFTEYIELRDKEEVKDYEYLRQFQQERMESEGSSTIPYREEVASDESSIAL